MGCPLRQSGSFCTNSLNIFLLASFVFTTLKMFLFSELGGIVVLIEFSLTSVLLVHKRPSIPLIEHDASKIWSPKFLVIAHLIPTLAYSIH